MKTANRNMAWACALIDELARHGVTHACVGSGSRSAPLVLALAADDRVAVHAVLDERSAGFAALGLGRRTGEPAAVVTTSGTAAANLLPAVIEASQAEAPLLLLTADRPPHLRGLDANQTIDQRRLFGQYVREELELPLPTASEPALLALRATAARAVSAAVGPVAGPVHINVPFDKPLEPTVFPGDVPADLATLAAEGRPDDAPYTRVAAGRLLPSDRAMRRLAERLDRAERGLIIAGPSSDPRRTGPAVLSLAEATGFPLLADPLSGARFVRGAETAAVAHYDPILSEEAVRERLAPDLVLRFGAAPTSATALKLIERTSTEQVVIDAGSRWKDALVTATEYVRADPMLVCDALVRKIDRSSGSAWTYEWSAASAAAASALAVEIEAGPWEGAMASALVDALPADATLFVGNSMPVRDVDAFAAPRDTPIHALGNRGASGIDGTVSSSIGAALGSDEPSVALLGDLALLHDLTALQLARRAAPDLTLVVIDNDGGGIFHMLPIRDYEPAFTPYVAMPHGLDLAAIVDAFGLSCERIDGVVGLRSGLRRASDAGGVHVLVATFDREANRERREAVFRQMAAAALATLSFDGHSGGREA